MKIELVAVDVDGTILTDAKELTEATCEAVAYAAEAGVEVAISTGRSLVELQDILPRLPQIRYVVIGTGAAVVDCQSQEELFTLGVSKADMLRCFDVLAQFPCMFEAYKNDAVYVDASCWEHHTDYTAPSPTPPPPNTRVPVGNLRQWMVDHKGHFLKGHVYFADTPTRDLALQALAHLPLSIMTSNSFDIEIMALGVDKGVGLSHLADYLQIPATNVMAVGDGWNDEAMLQYAGLSAVMGNGEPELKAKADIIADTNEADGVAKLIGSLLAGALVPTSYDNRIYLQ